MRLLLVSLFTTTALLPVSAAYAQEVSDQTTAADDMGMGDIVVTAERRSGTLQKTPIAITALPEEALTAMQIDRTADLQRITPSLSVAQGTVDPTTLTVFMRGAGQNAGTWVGYESAVGLYVDDLYFARLSGANLDLADLERIEVLRGPQGTLYGRNTLVGAIKYVTKKPDDQFYVNALAEYGTKDMVRLKGTVATPISDDWAVLASGNYYSRGGFYNAPAFDDDNYGNREEYGARVALEYIGTGPYQVSASAFYSRARNDGSIGLATDPVTLEPASDDPFDYLSPIDGIGGSEVYGGSLTLGYDISDNVTLKSISGVISGTQDILADTTGGQPTTDVNGPYPIGFDRLESDSNQTQISQEFQILGDADDDRLHYIGGVYFFRETGGQRRQDYLLNTYNTLEQDIDMRTTSLAAYAQATYDISDSVSAIMGLRYTHEKKSVKGVTQDGIAGTTFANIDASTTAEAFTPKFGLNWQVNDNIFAYISAAHGFQAGGFNYLAVVNPTAYETPFGPQTVWTYEVGIKTQFFDRKGRFNLAFYRNDFDDIQTNVIVNGSALTQNAGTARVQGVEAELSITPVTGLTFYGSGAFSDDEYLDIDPNSSAAQANATRIPNVSKWQASAGVAGDFDIGAGNLKMGADYSYISSKYLGGTNAEITKMPGYELVNAYVGFAPAGTNFEARVSVANAFDKLYYVYGNVLGAYGIRSPGDPRTFKVSLQYKY